MIPLKITVLAGGCSPEREVSLTSGSLIANALTANGHRVLLLDVYEGLRTLPDDPDTLFRTDGVYSHHITETVPNLEALRARCDNGSTLVGPNVLELCKRADLVFLALHGDMGENGQLQAMLDIYGIRYTGSGYVGSLLAMDKDLAKRLMRDAGIPTPEWVCLDAKTCAERERMLLERIGLPCVVKPCGCGSSVGVSMVNTPEELSAALRDAATWDSQVLVERKISGRELTVGILNGSCLPAVEIVPEEGFYDYKNKYQGTTREICPAELSAETAQRAAALTLRGFSALHLRGYARFDYLLDAQGTLWCLEANTLPGMTPTSLLPQAAAAVGINYEQLCETIVTISCSRGEDGGKR